MWPNRRSNRAPALQARQPTPRLNFRRPRQASLEALGMQNRPRHGCRMPFLVGSEPCFPFCSADPVTSTLLLLVVRGSKSRGRPRPPRISRRRDSHPTPLVSEAGGWLCWPTSMPDCVKRVLAGMFMPVRRGSSLRLGRRSNYGDSGRRQRAAHDISGSRGRLQLEGC